jgi:regulator of sigma E protease
VIPFLAIIVVVVFVHELGHFLIARLNGVRVDVFSIGFGREVVGFNDRYGTRWKISALPLGGYVRFFGDADAASARQEDGAAMSAEEKAVAFQFKRVWQRAAIVFAGPASNFLFAVVVFAAVFMAAGRLTSEPVVGAVVEGTAAAEAGLRAGDRIVAIQGNRVSRFQDIQRLVPLYGMEPMTITFERDGTTRSVLTHPAMVEADDGFGNVQTIPRLGIQVSREHVVLQRLGPVEAVGAAVENTWSVASATLVAFGQMITGSRGTDDLGGPLRIAEYSGQAAQLGLANFAMFVAVLSINLGLINLFPIPLLDGGHLLFYGVEGLRGRPLGERIQEVGLKLGLVVVFGIMIFATWNDILRFVQG